MKHDSEFAPSDDNFRGTKLTRKVEYVVEWWDRDEKGYEHLHSERYGSARDARKAWRKAMGLPGTYSHDIRKAEFIQGARWVSESILTEDEAAEAAQAYLDAPHNKALAEEVRRALRATTARATKALDEVAAAPAPVDPQRRGGVLQREGDGRGRRSAIVEPDWLA